MKSRCAGRRGIRGWSDLAARSFVSGVLFLCSAAIDKRAASCLEYLILLCCPVNVQHSNQVNRLAGFPSFTDEDA